MKYIYTLFILLTFPLFNDAQKSVLFVDDSGDQFMNSQYLASTLDSLGIEYYYYDANGLNESPFAEEMLAFDVVIWHTSSWGVGLHLWNKDKTLNPELVNYLNNPKAKFWLIGNDFMYDKYGTPVVDFNEGDFPYDFLGISQYKSQSYADDGKLGMPKATYMPTSGIGVNDLTWSVGNLWYADGFLLAPSATPVYMMDGENNYPLKSEITGCSNITPAKGHVLTYGFDLALAKNFDMMKDNVSAVLNWFDGLATNNKIKSLSINSAIFPNPTKGQFTIQLSSKADVQINIDLLDITGQFISSLDNGINVNSTMSNIMVDVPSNIANGVYIIRLSSKDSLKYMKLIIVN